MSRLKELLRVAPPSTRNTQQDVLHCCTTVAQHAHTTQQQGNDATIAGDWREFESLFAIVGPAYRTPAHEYPLMRQAARQDMPAALIAYGEMARQIKLQVKVVGDESTGNWPERLL